jgi:hypothetical protein
MVKRLLLSFLLLVYFLSITTPVKAGTHFNLYYLGPADSMVWRTFNDFGYISFVNDPEQADIFLFDSVIPDDERIAERIQTGYAKLILFLGSNIQPGQLKKLLGIKHTVKLTLTNVAVPMTTGDYENDTYLAWINDIRWSEAPLVGDRYIIESGDIIPVIQGKTDKSIIIGLVKSGSGYNGSPSSVSYIVSPFLDEKNKQLQEWKDFRYILFSFVFSGISWANREYFDLHYGSLHTPTPMPTLTDIRSMASLAVTSMPATRLVDTPKITVSPITKNVPAQSPVPNNALLYATIVSIITFMSGVILKALFFTRRK